MLPRLCIRIRIHFHFLRQVPVDQNPGPFLSDENIPCFCSSPISMKGSCFFVLFSIHSSTSPQRNSCSRWTAESGLGAHENTVISGLRRSGSALLGRLVVFINRMLGHNPEPRIASIWNSVRVFTSTKPKWGSRIHSHYGIRISWRSGSLPAGEGREHRV